MTYCRVVNELSLMIDVFVEVERLQKNLEALRDGLVMKPDQMHMEVYDALRNCRLIVTELQTIKSLMHGAEATRFNRGASPMPDPPPAPKGPPNIKLVS